MTLFRISRARGALVLFAAASAAGPAVAQTASLPMALAAAAGAPAPVSADESAPGGLLGRLLERSDLAAPADESPDQARSRRTLLLDMVARTPRCFVPNPTDDQLDYILRHFNALPVGAVNVHGPNPRFFTDNTVWTGTGGLGPAGRASGATLRYSFPNDGIAWGNTGNLNNLNARLESRFGQGNVDRGREFIRQGLAGWRRFAALNYIEVHDNSGPFSTGGAAGHGDIRIGSINQGLTGVLAYNFFPEDGGDMTLNTDELVPSSMFASSNNYRMLRNVVAHEHGHGLGYIHATPCNSTKLMEPFATPAFDLLQIDEVRGAQRNYGDRFAGNNSAANARDFGNLTTPILRSVIEKNLSTNGANGANDTHHDWFRFTIDSTQNVVLTVQPIGGSYANGQQTGGCNPSTPGTINASQAGNLNLELRNAAGNTVLQSSASAPAGSPETITANNLAPGTYTVRVVDVGPNSAQTVQLYDLTIRVGSAKAPPAPIAGLNKRVAAGQLCFFMGDINSRVNEPGAGLNSASYDWDLDGDGIFEVNDNPQPSRIYAANGVYNVTLRLTDSNGMQATDTITVTVAGAVSSVSTVSPSTGQAGATVPVTINGINLAGVTMASQVTVSGGGITVTGTPTVSGNGTIISGLSFVIAPGAAIGSRTVTITNADGTGQTASGSNVFSVTNTPPENDVCAGAISWGSVTGARPFTSTNATTGAPQGSFPGTGCPESGTIHNDVWYSWTAPANGNLTIGTDSAASGTPTPFSTRVAVYGGGCDNLTLLGCDDFGFVFTVQVAQGQTYLFQVGSALSTQSGTANVLLTLNTFSGACCDSAGFCAITTSNACIGGTYQGNGTLCEPSPCPLPEGTCCGPDGSCLVTLQDECGGVWSGGGVCEPNPCPQPVGACCAPDGACNMTEEAQCEAGSAWTSGGSCEPNPCEAPDGACCEGTACSISTEAACAGTFQGAGSVCGPAGNPTTCCPANFNQSSGVTVQDIFDFLAAYFASAPGADFNGQGGITVQDIFDFLAAYFQGC